MLEKVEMEYKEERGTMTVTETTTRKVSSRAGGHVTKNTVEVTERKYAPHSGIKFKFDPKKKVTVVKPFSFDNGPKIKKEKAFPPSPGKSGETQRDPGRQPRVTREFFKITKERSSSNTRSVSAERTSPRSPARSRSAKPQADTPKKAKSPKSLGNLLKPTISSAQKLKPQVHFSNADETDAKHSNEKGHEPSNAEKSHVSNGTKPLDHLLKPTISSAQKLKPQIHYFSEDGTEVKVHEEVRCESPNVEKSQGHGPNATNSLEHLLKQTISSAQKLKPHIHFSDEDVTEMKVSTEKACESPNAERSKPDVPKSELANIGSSEFWPSNGVAAIPKSDSSDGPLSELPNGSVNIHCEYSETKVVESTVSKTASKIPRKKCGAHTGMKFHFQPNIRKETIPQPFTFEKRCSNLKKENIQIEANQMKMTSMVNN